MDECIDSLGSAQVFSTLDANYGYWQIEMGECDMDKNSFVRHNGLYRYSRMSFELKNAPATFQKVIDVIPATVQWQHALVYSDDIIIFSSTPEDHIDRVESVLRLIKQARMMVMLKNCYFFSDAIDYFGHVITSGRLHVAIKTKNTIRTLKYPTNTAELRSFLDLCNVYRRFVSNFERKAMPLNKLPQKGEPKKSDLNDVGKVAVDELKETLINPPI